MKKQLIECVPNISEGRDKNIIDQVTAEIEKVEGVKLLDVDPGMTTNRTVITFVGEPEPVCEAAYRVVKKAAELIDMSQHHGAHPRQGATDVCPLIPVSNITMEEVVEYAHKLGKRLGEELNIPIYCYEEAAYIKERRNLAYCRTGEYESLASRLGTEQWKPDFGPNEWNEHVAHTGATQVGARDFLVAINYNLNTTSTRRANAIAFDVREKGRPMREGGKVTGKPMKDENGKPIMIPGTLKATKAIGWFIEDYGIAQVSMNITNISVSPVHVCFEEVCAKAAARGVRVTGCEIVGLVPKKVLMDAGRFYLAKQQRSLGVSEARRPEALRPEGKGHRIPHRRPQPEETRRHDLHGLCQRDRQRKPRSWWWLHFGLHGCPWCLFGHDGRQPVVAQAGLGRTLGRILQLGRQGPSYQGRVA